MERVVNDRRFNSHSEKRGRAVLLTAALIALLVTLIAPVFTVHAHPMGELTVNHFSNLQFDRNAVTVRYVIDFAELSTLEQVREIDQDRDGHSSDDEVGAYLDRMVPGLIDGLALTVDGQPVELVAERRSAEFLPGQGGFQTFRLEVEFRGDLPVRISDGPLSGRYRVENFPGRLGWHEIVIAGAPDVEIVETDALRQSVSNELWDYPEIEEAEPLLLYDVTFSVRLGDGAVDLLPIGEGARDEGGAGSLLARATDSVASLVRPDALSPLAIALTMGGAFLWGAFHALTPGHGKAIVAAYLIGRRGTARHAAFLGLTVTATHTSSIFALAIVTLSLSNVVLTETLFPWISVASGVLVIGIGASLGYQRFRQYRQRETGGHHHEHHHDHDHHHHHDHQHDHSHLPHHHAHAHDHHHHGQHGHSHLPPGASGEVVTWRSLLALGISGGLVPCPSALLLLLGAISLNRLEFGILLVLLFSIGLAAVLTGIGLLLVYSRGLFNRFSFETRLPSLLPVASSAAITLAGVIIVAGALRQAGVL